jgi:protein-disulfide isomerase
MKAEPLVEGYPSSAIRALSYEDLQCPDCAAYRQMLDEDLLPKYGAEVAFEHREFPLKKHLWARPAAVAARYFGSLRPDLGTSFRQYCASELPEITDRNFEAKVREFAKRTDTDPDSAAAALNNPVLADTVEEDYQEGLAKGVQRTPTVFVNRTSLIEEFTLEEISKSIEAAMAAVQKNK